MATLYIRSLDYLYLVGMNVISNFRVHIINEKLMQIEIVDDSHYIHSFPKPHSTRCHIGKIH